ncbi:MAG: hypothetical protein ACKPKO_51210, partial [Candidatus Fonsibacter sp.]
MPATGAAHAELEQHVARTFAAKNYVSVEANRDVVEPEAQRLHAQGFVTFYKSWADVQARFLNPVVS